MLRFADAEAIGHDPFPHPFGVCPCPNRARMALGILRAGSVVMMSRHETTAHDIARAARVGELISEALRKILERRPGSVNCYAEHPTHTCHAIVYFIALEGRMDHQSQ